MIWFLCFPGTLFSDKFSVHLILYSYWYTLCLSEVYTDSLLLSGFWNLTRLSCVCFIVGVLICSFSSKDLISVFYYFHCFFPSIVTRLGWLDFRIPTNRMVLFPDLFFLMFLRFPRTLSTSRSFHTTWPRNYLSLSSADFWLSNCAIWAIIFWSYFQRSPLFLHWNLFFLLNTISLSTNLKKLTMFIWQFNFLCLSNFKVEFVVIPSFPQGLFLLLAEFRTLWLLLF